MTEHPGLSWTGGRHGMGTVGKAMGPVSGFVIDGVHVASDTGWCDEVRAALETYRPRAVIVNAGAARFIDSAPIVMTAADVRRVRHATDAKIVVVHLEAMNHRIESRELYRAIDDVLVPSDGETLAL